MRSRSRYLLPVGVIGVIALGTGVPRLASASSDIGPTLAPIDAHQLVVNVQGAHVAGLSGTVEWVANLGLPSLAGLTGGAGQGASASTFDPTTLLSGTHTVSVWDAGKDRQRLAMAYGSLTEMDLVRNGQQAWAFDSSTQKVTHYVAAPSTDAAAPDAAAPDTTSPTTPELTPDQVATRLLDHLGATTDVTVPTTATVAGQPAYVLQLTPKASAAPDSTVGSITIAVDANNWVPLQVQVFPKGAGGVALSLGYSTVDFHVPDAANFAAPTGTSTVTKTLGGQPGAQHDAASAADPAQPDAAQADAATRPTVLGAGWDTIATLPAGNHSVASATSKIAAIATTVPVGAGSAKLVTTRLLNALVLPDGRVLAGFVTPAALEAAAVTPPPAG